MVGRVGIWFTSFDGSVTSVPYPSFLKMAKVQLRIHLPRIPVHKPRVCFAVIAGSSCFATLPSHAASGRRAEMLYRVAFEGTNLTKMSLVMATAGWPTICCSRCCGSTTRIVKVTVVAAAGFG
jgi:hypothetical protein